MLFEVLAKNGFGIFGPYLILCLRGSCASELSP